MPVVKRSGDDPGENHTEERHPPIDWKVVAPRWMLVVTIGALLFSTGWLISSNRNLSDDRLARMERYQSDARWDLLIKHGEDLTDLKRQVQRHNDALEKLAGLAEDVRVLRRIAEASRRKNGGGYGL